MAAKSMHAVQYSGYGGGADALKHVEVPIPKPKDDEVLLKVEATSLNQIDLKIQKGAMRPIFPRKFPFIPGSDVAGEVVQAGAKVTRFKVGDKVVSRVAAVSGGALAEYVVAKENQTVTRPRQVSAADGAALPIAALTAHQAIAELANIKLDGTGDKKNVLIIAASGGVGHYAVQLAKLGNTHVTATCGARNLDLVKSLGADEVIDYKTPDGAALKSPSGKKYDYIINCGPVSPWFSLDPNLSRTGKVIDLNPGITTAWTISLKKLTFSKKQLVFLIFQLKIENFDYVVNLVKEGKLKTVIDSKYSLSKAEDGWAKIMDGHATGKIIIEP